MLSLKELRPEENLILRPQCKLIERLQIFEIGQTTRVGQVGLPGFHQQLYPVVEYDAAQWVVLHQFEGSVYNGHSRLNVACPRGSAQHVKSRGTFDFRIRCRYSLLLSETSSNLARFGKIGVPTPLMKHQVNTQLRGIGLFFGLWQARVVVGSFELDAVCVVLDELKERFFRWIELVELLVARVEDRIALGVLPAHNLIYLFNGEFLELQRSDRSFSEDRSRGAAKTPK